jgi:hypothetical protein
MTGVAASVYRPRLRLAPSVIDLTIEAAGEKENDRSNGWSEKREQEFTVRSYPTSERHAANADSMRSRVG